MPISKRNRLYYTPEQYARAKRNANALAYAQSQGYDLVRCGSYYTLRQHDSMVFTPDGKWFWNSRQVRGSALEFMTCYEGRSFAEAVLLLAGSTEQQPPPGNSVSWPKANPPKGTTPSEFKLPPRAKDMRRLFAYLCGTRKLNYQVVREMIAQEIVYESTFQTRSKKTLHNACFVSYDNMGRPCSAFQRGMTPGTNYKGEVPGGCKDYGWVLHGEHPSKLYVFEAAIDAASYVSLLRRQGVNPLTDGDFLALGGLNFTPIARYLQRSPHIGQVILLLDADPPGQAAAQRFQALLLELGCLVSLQLPPTGKDWNDALCAIAAGG